jgi:hypothetical protein
LDDDGDTNSGITKEDDNETNEYTRNAKEPARVAWPTLSCTASSSNNVLL